MNPTPRTLNRINYLLQPETLDALLDEFQSQGMPMGSDRWAEHCLTLLRQRREESRALEKVMDYINEATKQRSRAYDSFYIQERQRLIKDHQQRAEIRDGLSETTKGITVEPTEVTNA